MKVITVLRLKDWVTLGVMAIVLLIMIGYLVNVYVIEPVGKWIKSWKEKG